MRNAIGAILNDADLYGYNLTVGELKKRYSHVLHRPNSIPSSGSLCRESADLKECKESYIFKAIQHRDGTVTLVTQKGYLKFINL